MKGGGCKRDGWVVTDCELIDGKEFIKLTRGDSGFCRFVSGHSKAMRDMKFMEKLRWLRTQASIELGKPPEEGVALFDSSSSKEKTDSRRDKKQMKESSKDLHQRGELPLTCKVTLPQVQDENGNVFASREVVVKTCLDPKAVVTMEFKSEALDHVRCLLLTSEAPTSRKGRRSGQQGGVRVRPNGYVACRNSGNKCCYKTFRVRHDADEIEKAEIAEKAQRWVEGEECDDPVQSDEANDGDQVDQVSEHSEDEQQDEAFDGEATDSVPTSETVTV